MVKITYQQNFNKITGIWKVLENKDRMMYGTELKKKSISYSS